MEIVIIVFSALLLLTIHGIDMKVHSSDIKIGALFSVHESPDPLDPYFKCGKIRGFHGIQKIESAFLALDMINNNSKILPGIKLGMEIRDTCWSEILALRQTLGLIWGRSVKNTLDELKNVQNHFIRKKYQHKTIIKNSSIVGVIGPETTEESLQVQKLLKLFHIPQIGYYDTMEDLHKNIEYPTFLRAAPCDSFQTKVIHDILNKFNWTNIITVHTRGAYGEAIFKSFRNLMESKSNHSRICTAAHYAINLNINKPDAEDLIHKLDDYKSVNVVICFCEKEILKHLFEATKRLNLTNRFTFIISDGWGDLKLISQGVEEQAWGSIFVRIHASKIPKFMEYYTSLKPAENTRNPWFTEFWEDRFNCTLPKKANRSKKNNAKDKNETNLVSVSKKLCTGNESLAENYYEHRKTYFVMSAVTIMAQALHQMIGKICGVNYTGLCPEIQPFDTSKIVDHLMDISFTFENFISFEHGKPQPRYDILNFQKLSNNKFEWIQIGSWDQQTLKLVGELQNRQERNFTGVCSLPCPIGHYKLFECDDQNQNCYWNCRLCGTYDFVSFDQKQCIECAFGEKPNANRTGCIEILIPVIHWQRQIVILIIIFTITGLIGTFFTLCLLVKYKDSPIARASNSKFSYLIIASMFLTYISVFATLVEATQFFCELARILPGVSLTMMYASLFTEIIRIVRVSDYLKNRCLRKKSSLISIPFQLAIAFLFIAIETVVCFATIIASPSILEMNFSNRFHPITSCSTSTFDVLSPLALIFFLHVVCIVYTFKTRNIPGNFNEVKFMGFAMLISSLVWIIFMTAYFGTIMLKKVAMSMCLTLYPSFILIFLFFPKLYIIIFRSEKNDIELITSKSIRTIVRSQSQMDTAESKSKSICHSVYILHENDSSLAESNRKSRKNVAVQTGLEIFRNVMLSPNNDSELVIEESNSESRHDSSNTMSKYDNTISILENSKKKKNASTFRKEFCEETDKSLNSELDSFQLE